MRIDHRAIHRHSTVIFDCSVNAAFALTVGQHRDYYHHAEGFASSPTLFDEFFSHHRLNESQALTLHGLIVVNRQFHQLSPKGTTHPDLRENAMKTFLVMMTLIF